MNDVARVHYIPADNDLSLQVLTFSLDNQQFGVNILQVREIRGWTSITKIPQTPDYVLGVLNLRGAVVPIIDLRAKLGMPSRECTPLTVVIVLSIAMGSFHRLCGLVVDRVADVVDIATDQRRSMPTVDDGARSQYVHTLAVVADTMIIILDTEALLGRDTDTSENQALTTDIAMHNIRSSESNTSNTSEEKLK